MREFYIIILGCSMIVISVFTFSCTSIYVKHCCCNRGDDSDSDISISTDILDNP